MKPRLFSILVAGLFAAPLVGWSVAAPAPAAGRPKEIASFQAHRSDVEGLAFSPDGKTLASGGREGKIKLWDVASGKNLLDFQAHRSDGRGQLGIVLGVAFSPDGKIIASSGEDRKVKFWEAATGDLTDTLDDVGMAPPLSFSPDGRTLICGYRRFDLKTRKAHPLVEKGAGKWPVVGFKPKGEIMVGMSFLHPEPPSFILWDVKTGKKILTYKGDRKIVTFAAFSPGAKIAVSTEGDVETRRWTIRLWDTASGKKTATFEQPEIPYFPTFSPDGKILAVSCKPAADRNDYPGSIRLFAVPSGKVLATLKGHERLVGCLAFSPDGRSLATGALRGIIKIWRLPARFKAD